MTDLLIVCICATAVLVAMTAAWLVARVARDALAKADPEDVPEIVAGMRGLLDGFQGFLPRGMDVGSPLDATDDSQPRPAIDAEVGIGENR